MIKLSLLVLLALSSFSISAQTVETIINGQRYLCTPQAQDPGGAGRCADVAYRGPFTRQEALRLCQGARTDAPAQCALQAYRGPFTTEQAIALCSGAFTIGPVECALTAYRGPFTITQALELCSHPAASAATSQCALDAYRALTAWKRRYHFVVSKNPMKSLSGFQKAYWKSSSLRRTVRQSSVTNTNNCHFTTIQGKAKLLPCFSLNSPLAASSSATNASSLMSN